MMMQTPPVDKIEFEFVSGKKGSNKIVWLSNKVIPALSREEEYELLKDKKVGEAPPEKTMEKLILSNIPIVITICSKDFNLSNTGFMQEAISVSLLAMIDSAKHFDPKKGIRYMSYAMVSVRQKLSHFIINQKTIEHRGENFRKNAMIVVKFLKDNKDIYLTPRTVAIVAEKTGVDEKRVEEMIPFFYGNKHLDGLPTSGDEHTDPISKKTLGYLMRNRNLLQECEDTKVEEDQEKLRLKDTVKSLLSPKEYFIISRLFGLEGHNLFTLEEIAQEFIPRVTRQAISLRCKKALKKLKNNNVIQNIDRTVVYDD